MKKSLLALAVLGAFAGSAVAQSSVTLFGIVDMSARYVKNDDQERRISLATDGVNSSRLGFRGIEDLGGGLRAGFWLEAGIAPDTGGATLSATPGATIVNQSKFFNRRSTVSLISNAGELRLGRDYVPTFWNSTIFDAFGTNGLGSSLNVQRYFHVRQDNSIGYFLPSNIGGFYGQFMMAAGEAASPSTQATSLDKPGRYLGGRLGFAAGPFDVAFAASEQRFATGALTIPALGGLVSDDVNEFTLGGSWDFGFFKLLGYVRKVNANDADERMASISALFRFGQGEFRIGYDHSKLELDLPGLTTDSTVKQAKVTYQYNISRRTALYGTASWLDNNDGAAVGLPGGFGTPGFGGTSWGAEMGVRHIF